MDIQARARQALKMRHEFYGSWADVADELELNKGLLCNIHNGKRKASRGVLAALGIEVPELALAPVCPKHGVVHVGRCPRKTFEENAAAYDNWKCKNAAKLAALMQEIP